MDFISAGYGNLVNADRIIAVVTSGTAPSKRIIQDAKDNGRCIDVTCGRKTKSIIVMDSDHVVLSPVRSATLLLRLKAVTDGTEADDLDEDNDEEAEDEAGE